MNSPPQKGRGCREVAVVEGFRQQPMYEQSTPKKVAVVERWPSLRGLNESQCMNFPPQKSGHCREVAIVEGFKQEPMYEQSTPKKWPL